MRAEEAISASIKRAEARLEREEQKLHEAQGRRLMKCHSRQCGRKSRLSKWIFIVNHHYIRPYSCSEGDYWTRSERGESLVCPKCGHEHRRCFLEPAMTAADFKVAEKVAGHLLERYDKGDVHRDSYCVIR